MNRPLLFLVCGFVAGEVIGRFANLAVVIIIVIGMLILIGGFSNKTIRNSIPFRVEFSVWYIIGFIFMCGGIISGELCKTSDQLSEYINNEECIVIGKINNIENGTYGPVVMITSVNIYNKDFSCNKKVEIRVTNVECDDFKIGNIIKIQGILSNLKKPTNYGEFNSELFYKSKNVDFMFKAEKSEVVSEDINVFKEFLKKIKRKFIVIYHNILPEKEANIIIAMLLGDKAGLDGRINRLYQKAGISHVISISGLHMALIGGTIFKLLRKTGLPYSVAGIIGITFIITYGMLVGLAGATLRAVIMLSIAIFADMLGRTYDMPTAMALSAFIMLFFNGYRLTDAGFLLSFGAILAIGFVYPELKEVVKDLKKFFENRNKKKILTDKKKQRIVISKIIDGFLISIATQIITTPIVMYFYYQIPISGIITNMIIIPLMSILMPLAILGGVFGCISSRFAYIIVYPCYLILKFTEKICLFMTSLPGSMITTGCPTLTEIIAYYICVTGILILLHYKKYRYIPIIFGIGLSVTLMKTRNLKIVMMDVGQGDGIYINTPSDKNILIDGGSSSNLSVGQYVIVPTLRYYGVKTIDYAVVSHGDSDHISGLVYILENYDDVDIEIKYIILPDIDGKNGQTPKIYEDSSYNKIINLAKIHGVQIVYFGRGDNLIIDKVKMECLHPNGVYVGEDRNSYSTVMKLEYENFKMMFTGDVNLSGEEEFINKWEQYDILKIAHHGSSTSSGEEFLNVIQPKYALISCGLNNSYGHPHKELLDRLDNINADTHITKDNGAILIKVKEEGYYITDYLENEHN